MNPLAWLISLAMPACGYTGTQGLPIPPVMDVAHIVRPASPNTALAAPEGFSPEPDLVTPRYDVPAATLFAAIRQVAQEQPRTYQAALYAGQLQVDYVSRSEVFNFPDLIMVKVQPNGTDSSKLVVYSRSVYGYGDLGVNRKRVATWLAALQSSLSSTSKR
jgi:uncharacterized protein (DUF1499 family)